MSERIGRKVDVVSTDMCHMSCAEFAYEISDGALFLNGLQTYAVGDYDDQGEFIDNWQYDAIYRGLSENPGWGGEEFALHQLANMNAIGPYLFPSIAMAHMQTTDAFGVSRLDAAADFVAAMDTLALELYEAVTGPQEHLAEEQLQVQVLGHPETPPDRCTETFTGCSAFMARTPFKMFDVGDFLQRLYDHGDRLCDPETAEAALEAYRELIAGNVHGDNWLAGEHPDATGLSIYIPYQVRSFYLEEYRTTRFAQDTHWDEFLAEVPWNA
jgi:hypothetical protein